MSSLKLLHSGGNGVIISAPSSNPAANRTITLNDTYGGDGSFVTANSSGNVGIGTASPACDLHVSAANPRARFTSTGNTVNYDIFMGSTTATVGTSSNHDTLFMTNDSERMRIDASGNLKFTGSGTQHIDMFNSGDCMDVQTAGTGTQNYGMIVFKNGSGTYCGQVTSNAGNTTTSYLSASDYRLKENEKIITDGITRIKQLKPYRFKWKATGDEVDGFFAHEAQTVVPESVGGTKDEVDSDNKPIYQGIDQSKLVPLLTAALQEAVAKIETLETKVAALEGA